MKPDQARQFLQTALDELGQARGHLDHSARQVAALPADLQDVTATQLESVEAFSIIVQRISPFPLISAFQRFSFCLEQTA